MSVLIDTGVLFAAASGKDAKHRPAARLLARVATESPFATDHVLSETWALLRCRAGWKQAMRFWRSLRDTPLRIEIVTLVDLERASAIADAWSDRQFDLVDCTSFAVMERLGCHRVATFDTDFAIYRHGGERSRAFEVLH